MEEAIKNLNTYAKQIQQKMTNDCVITKADIEYLHNFIQKRIDTYVYYQELKYMRNDMQSLTLRSVYRSARKQKPSNRILIIHKLQLPKFQNTFLKAIFNKLFGILGMNYNKEEAMGLVKKWERLFTQPNQYFILDNKYLVIYISEDRLKFESIYEIDLQCIHQQKDISNEYYSQFRELIIFNSDNSIKQEYIHDLLDFLNRALSISKISLNLPFNEIRKKDISNIGYNIMKQQQVTELEIEQKQSANKQENEKQKVYYYSNKIYFFFEKIATCSSITHLTLKLNSIQFQNKCLTSLAQSLLKFPLLVYLHVEVKNKSANNGVARAIGMTVARLQNLCSLKLALRDGSIDKKGSKALAQGIRSGAQLSSLCLDVRCNNIQLSGATQLLQAISTISTLRHLTLLFYHNNIHNSLVLQLLSFFSSIINLSVLITDFNFVFGQASTQKQLLRSIKKLNLRLVTIFFKYPISKRIQ